MLNASLSELIGELQDTGWVGVTLGYGISEMSGRTPQVRRIGNIVYMRGRVTAITIWEQHDSMITIPEGFRPEKDTPFIQSSTGSFRYRMEIMTTGKVVANGITNNTYGNYTAEVDQWFALESTLVIN